MPVATLNCPACGASSSADATRCDYCGASLATVACPSCFGLIFVGAKFCSHCGAKAEKTEVASAVKRLCPRCQTDMSAVIVAQSNLWECSRCEGIWTDAATLAKICDEREKQSAILGMAAHPAEAEAEKNIRYIPCPECHQLMNRMNFAHCSGVIVNVCKAHGTWFDKDELRRIVEFVQAGGLTKARAQELAEIDEKRRKLQQEQKAANGYGSAGFFNAEQSATVHFYSSHSTTAVDDVADFLVSLFNR